MALSTVGYQTVGTQPGTVAARGGYTPVTGAGATYNGVTQYTNGTSWLSYNSNWTIQSSISTNGVPTYYCGADGTPTNVPLTGWSGGNGASPTPTFAVIPFGYTASGAGNTAANSSYTICPAPNTIFNGLGQYTNGTYFLDYNPTLAANVGAWEISTVINNPGVSSSNANQLYQGPSDAARIFNFTGWTTAMNGTAPAPTFSLFPQLPIGTQTTIPPTGTDAPTSLNWGSIPYNGWEIVNPAGTVIAWAQRYTSGGNPPTDNMNGWYTSAAFPYTTNSTTGANTITSFPLTPPIGTPIATGYEIRALHGYVPAASAYFDVVPALPVVLRNQTRIIIY